MRWKIEGADAGTGSEVRITVEALTRDEAEAKARYNGILVSSVTAMVPEPAPQLAYEAQPVGPVISDPLKPDEGEPASPELQELAAAARTVHPPKALSYRTPETSRSGMPVYGDIVAGAERLRILAVIVSGIGWVGVAMGCAFFILSMLQSGGLVFAIVPSLVIVAAGGGMIVAAALIRMGASLALAIRDIARNSFYIQASAADS